MGPRVNLVVGRRRLVWAALAVPVLVLAAAVPGRSASAAADKPDLVPILTDVPSATQKAPVYVDTFVKAPKVVYRFDAIIFNQGGTLDVYRDPASGHVMQAIWAGGNPSVPPDSNAPPPAGAPGLTVEDRTPNGAKFEYQAGGDHNHFHLLRVAVYQLLVPGLGAIGSAKVGFCLADDWGTPPARYYPYPYTGPGLPWCAVGHPDATFFREGISPQAGDIYNAQVQDQWIDVSGLTPGTYTLQAAVNPGSLLDESDTSNNSVQAQRTIPGTIAQAATVASLPHGPVAIPVAGTIVAPDVPARVSPQCFPRASSTDCLRTAAATGPLAFKVATQPCHGRVTMAQAAGLATTATYTPAAGVVQADGFSYTVTDVRGLVSAPAFVRIGRPDRTGPPRACLIGARIGPDRRAHLEFVSSGKLPRGAHWAVYVDAKPGPRASGATSAETKPLTPGRNGVWLELVQANGKPFRHRIQSRELTLRAP